MQIDIDRGITEMYNKLSFRKGKQMKMSDSEAKKKWVKENTVMVSFKLFKAIGQNQNDQDILDYFEGKTRSEIIKAALREYIENHKE